MCETKINDRDREALRNYFHEIYAIEGEIGNARKRERERERGASQRGYLPQIRKSRRRRGVIRRVKSPVLSPIGTGVTRETFPAVCLVQNTSCVCTVYFYSCVDACDVNVRVCDPKIEDGTIRKIEPSAVFFHDGRYIQVYFLGRLPLFHESLSSILLFTYLFFFFLHLSVTALSGLAWLRSAQQRETTRTINDFFRRWANLCVSCDLLLLHPLSSHHFSSSSSPSALYRADRELPLSCHPSYFT